VVNARHVAASPMAAYPCEGMPDKSNENPRCALLTIALVGFLPLVEMTMQGTPPRLNGSRLRRIKLFRQAASVIPQTHEVMKKFGLS